MGLLASLGFMNASVGTGMLLGLSQASPEAHMYFQVKGDTPRTTAIDNLHQELMNTSVKERVTVPNISIAVVHCQ